MEETSISTSASTSKTKSGDILFDINCIIFFIFAIIFAAYLVGHDAREYVHNINDQKFIFDVNQINSITQYKDGSQWAELQLYNTTVEYPIQNNYINYTEAAKFNIKVELVSNIDKAELTNNYQLLYPMDKIIYIDDVHKDKDGYTMSDFIEKTDIAKNLEE